MIKILAIDPAIKTGLALFNMEEESGHFFLSRVDHISPKRSEIKGEDLFLYSEGLIAYIRTCAPHIIAIEQPFGLRIQSVFPTIERISSIKIALYRPENRDVLDNMIIKEVEMVPVTAWKKEIIGNGRASKEEVYSAVGHIFEKDLAGLLSERGPLTQDEADAIAIGAKVCRQIEIG